MARSKVQQATPSRVTNLGASMNVQSIRRVSLSRLVSFIAAAFLSSWVVMVAQQPYVSANLDEGAAQSTRHARPAQDVHAAMAQEDLYSAKLGPGYLLSMTVFGIPEYSDLPPTRVDAAGNIYVTGLTVPVHVGGLDILQAERAVASALENGQILVNPLVRLTIIEFAASNIAVLGEVEAPGRYPVLAPRSLGDVLSLAGGALASSSGVIEVQHAQAGGTATTETIAAKQSNRAQQLRAIMVSPGDTVVVHRAGVVYVLGAVGRPGGYLMINGGTLDLYEALAVAGGLNVNSKGGGLVIIRPGKDGQAYQEIKVPFSSIVRRTQDAAKLQPDDVVFVPRSGVKVALLDAAGIIGAALSSVTYTLR